MADLEMLARGKTEQSSFSWEISLAMKSKRLHHSAFLPVFFPSAQWLMYPAIAEIESSLRHNKTTLQLCGPRVPFP